MSKSVGKSIVRVDAYEKATGRAKYMDDLCDLISPFPPRATLGPWTPIIRTWRTGSC